MVDFMLLILFYSTVAIPYIQQVECFYLNLAFCHSSTGIYGMMQESKAYNLFKSINRYLNRLRDMCAQPMCNTIILRHLYPTFYMSFNSITLR